MARDRFTPAARTALRSMSPTDPLGPLVMQTMKARGMPIDESYLDALSEADERDLSDAERRELNPREPEPDNDPDDVAMMQRRRMVR